MTKTMTLEEIADVCREHWGPGWRKKLTEAINTHYPPGYTYPYVVKIFSRKVALSDRFATILHRTVKIAMRQPAKLIQ